MTSTPPTSAKDWQRLYEEANTGWDLGGPTPVIRAALDVGLLGPRGRVLVPGAGRGHDAMLLAERGFDVTALDFAESAAAHIETTRRERGLDMTVWQRDIFTLVDDPPGSFDACVEYTCFVAIDPERRADYVRAISHVVRPGGRMLFLAFPIGKVTPGPPHGVTIEELRESFSPQWKWILDAEAPASVPARRPAERLVLLERRES